MITWKNIINYTTEGNPEPKRRVEKSDREWQDLLTTEQFNITRLKGTEPAGTGALCYAHEAGIYSCLCCDNELFNSTIKFESGSGWPSFTQPIHLAAVKYMKDNSFGMIRVEVMCNVCDSHLGHVFPDGPEPSGLRYCINSESIKLNKN